MPSTTQLHVVVLDDPSQIWEAPQVPDLFARAIGLKLAGYRDKYPSGVLPVDATDFVGTHVLVCREQGGQLDPVMGFRSLTYSRCRFHYLTFPLLSIARNSNAPKHARCVEEEIRRCEAQGIELHYNGGWTIHPKVREDATLRPLFKDLMVALDYFHHDGGRKPYELLGAGVIRLKTDAFFESYGYESLGFEGVPLAPVQSHYLAGEPVRFIQVKKYTQRAYDCAERFKGLWDQRLVYSADTLRRAEVSSSQAA